MHTFPVPDFYKDQRCLHSSSLELRVHRATAEPSENSRDIALDLSSDCRCMIFSGTHHHLCGSHVLLPSASTCQSPGRSIVHGKRFSLLVSAGLELCGTNRIVRLERCNFDLYQKNVRYNSGVPHSKRLARMRSLGHSDLIHHSARFALSQVCRILKSMASWLA